MKHSLTITLVLLGMFLLTQLIGLGVVSFYAPHTEQVVKFNEDNTTSIANIMTYDLPYGMAPPQDLEPKSSLVSIVIALIIAIVLMLLLMRLNAETFLLLWFFVVVVIALGITLTAVLSPFAAASYIAILVALPLAYLKIFKRNLIVHNITELLIYPGIAAIFIPLVTITTAVILLVLISLYDMYAVWHTGFMQRMAHYQIKTLRIFSGFFIPYVNPRHKSNFAKATKKGKSVKVSVAILGGGDVVFPIIPAGVVMQQLSFWHGFIVSIGATIALATLLYLSEKGKFYPAMPFISIGCFIALGIAYLL